MPRTGRPRKTFVGEDPFTLVGRIPLGSKLRRMQVDGQSYWYARTPARPGVKSRKVYVGSDANKAVLERAWAAVQGQITELEATPEGRKLRALEAIAGGPTLARAKADDVVEVESPQQVLRFAAGRAGPRRPKE